MNQWKVCWWGWPMVLGLSACGGDADDGTNSGMAGESNLQAGDTSRSGSAEQGGSDVEQGGRSDGGGGGRYQPTAGRVGGAGGSTDAGTGGRPPTSGGASNPLGGASNPLGGASNPLGGASNPLGGTAGTGVGSSLSGGPAAGGMSDGGAGAVAQGGAGAGEGAVAGVGLGGTQSGGEAGTMVAGGGSAGEAGAAGRQGYTACDPDIPGPGCNGDPLSSAIYGQCEEDGTCTCIEGTVHHPITGRCIPPVGDCGDVEVMERYAECSASSSEVECTELGGTWQPRVIEGQPVPGEYECDCPTGDESCLCISSSDCMGICQARHSDEEICVIFRTGQCGKFSGGCVTILGAESECLAVCE